MATSGFDESKVPETETVLSTSGATMISTPIERLNSSMTAFSVDLEKKSLPSIQSRPSFTAVESFKINSPEADKEPASFASRVKPLSGSDC